ncbi:DNA mismatch repair protein MutS [Nocardia halotolerans]|uniref:DNA mismatch repair protein MutS n=1 Tax=Nocardia halotolerans TaxID=1755878 RepID=A0ABV8VBC7_9NOCA
MSGISVLWPRSTVGPDLGVDDDALADLNIDQIITAIVAGDEYQLRPWFNRPVRCAQTVRYRQEVFADLTDESVRTTFTDFAASMQNTRELLGRRARAQHPCQRQRWQLSASTEYLDAVTRLAQAVALLPLTSRALRRWREYVTAYVAGPDFGRLVEDVRRVQRALDEVRYGVRIIERTLTVTPAGTAPDYSVLITDLFSRFGSAVPRPPRQRSEWDDLNQMEEQVLDRVAALHPAAFGQLAEFARRHEGFAHPAVLGFEREIWFYLTYLAFVRRVSGTTRSMCLPRIADPGASVHAEDAFDLALFTVRSRAETAVVCNGWRISDPERVLVVTGPNQGGKTTFARTVGQLFYFAALGCPVPARTASLPLPDRLFTHFERAEQAVDPDGRLAEELVRIRRVLEMATAVSVIVLNESFSATSTLDGLRISRDVLARIAERGSIGVWVTFFHELARGNPTTVSMVAATDPEDPARRTFRIERRPPDGDSPAVGLAQHFGLTYDHITARISACR